MSGPGDETGRGPSISSGLGLAPDLLARPQVGELHHVALSVRDMERSLAFYRDGLGLRVTLDKRAGGPATERHLRLPAGAGARTVFLQGPSRIGQVELMAWNLPAPLDSRPKRLGDPGICVLSFPVPADQIGPLHQRLQAMGVECYTPPTEVVIQDYGPVTLFVCLDPDGNMVELISLPSSEEVRAFRAAARAQHGS
jgi:lactoylglutathione lyase